MPTGDDRRTGKPVQGRRSAASIASSALSRATGYSPAEKWPEKIEVQTRYAAELYNVDVR